MSENNYNPDVLSCIANLSSDEVFTPPQLVNQILDVLPEDLWSDKKPPSLIRAVSQACSSEKSLSASTKD